MRWPPALVATLVFLPACCGMCGMCSESTRSANVRTGAVRAEIDARSDGAKTDIVTRLRVGGPMSNVFLDLGDGDRLEASNGAERVGFSLRKGIVEPPAYVGLLRGDSAGRTLAIELVRPRDIGTKSSVTMPASFVITAPRAHETFSATHGAVTLRWSPPSASTMSWSVEGACVQEDSGVVPHDTGELNVLLKAAPTAPDAGSTGPCDATIHLERQNVGSLDPAFGAGGSIAATQWRALVVEFAP